MTFPKQRYLQDVDYAIGTDANQLSKLRWMKIPVPDQVVFGPASMYYYRGDGTRVGDGYITCQWIWDVISLEKLAPLLSFLAGATYKRDIYIRTDVRDGTYYNPRSAFKVYSAIMLKPILSGQEGTPLARSPYNLQTVPIIFKNLVEQ